MHAGFHELTEIAAGRRPADAHVAGCPDCARELERVRRVRSGLEALPELAPPPDAWDTISRRAAAAPRLVRRRTLPAAAAAALLAAVVALWLLPEPPEGAGPGAGVPEGTALAGLLEENARLEALLAELPEPSTMRLGTAYTVAALEDRLAMVDDGITAVTLEPYRPDVAEELWRERVVLMNSLVQVRYGRVLTSQ